MARTFTSFLGDVVLILDVLAWLASSVSLTGERDFLLGVRSTSLSEPVLVLGLLRYPEFTLVGGRSLSCLLRTPFGLFSSAMRGVLGATEGLLGVLEVLRLMARDLARAPGLGESIEAPFFSSETGTEPLRTGVSGGRSLSNSSGEM